MSGKIIKEGWLVKSPPLHKSMSQWKKRYFRLYESGRLDYFETNRNATPKGIINLLDVQEITMPLKREFDKLHCVKIATKDRIFVLQCSDEAEQKSWHEVIAATVAVATGEPNVAAIPETNAAADFDTGMQPNAARQHMPLPDVPPTSSRPSVPDDKMRPASSTLGRAGNSGQPPPATKPFPPSKPYSPVGGQALPHRDLPSTQPKPGGAFPPHSTRPPSPPSSGRPTFPRRPTSMLESSDTDRLNLGPNRHQPSNRSDSSSSMPALPPRPGAGGAVPYPSDPGLSSGIRRQGGYTMVDFTQNRPSVVPPSQPPPPSLRSNGPGARTNYTEVDLRKTEEIRQQTTVRPENGARGPPTGQHSLGENRQDSVGYVEMVHPSSVPPDGQELYDYEQMNLSGPPPMPGYPQPQGYPMPQPAPPPTMGPKPGDTPSYPAPKPATVPRHSEMPPKPLPRERSIRRNINNPAPTGGAPPALPSRRY